MFSDSCNSWIWRGIGWLAFNRISIVNRHNLPTQGPVLFVATHRNGALDAAPYKYVVPRAIPMVSAQLHRLPLGRILFCGIPVARAKDKARGIQADNHAAMQQCLALLRAGRQLLIMPEGTSTLGPAHLPFQRGAARIAQTAIASGIALTVVPLGVHYEDPTTWQSRVEVMVGTPRQISEGDTASLHREIVTALEEVGANFADATSQHIAQRLAYACTLGTQHAYASMLLSLAKQLPPELKAAAESLDQIATAQPLCLHQGVPLFPTGALPLYLGYWLLLLPVIGSFVLLNLPVILAAKLASRLLPDDTNVIAFWRMLIGLPVAVVWAIAITIAMLWLAQPVLLTLYWVSNFLGIRSWYRFRKLSITLCNALFHRGARNAVLTIYQTLLKWLPHA